MTLPRHAPILPFSSPPKASWRRLWLLYFLFTAGMQLANGVAHTLLLTRGGVDMLPATFAARGLFVLLASAAYVPLAGHIDARRMLALINGLIALFLLGAYALLQSGLSLSYPALYVLTETSETIFKIHFGVVLLACLPADEILSRLPLVYSGARAGAVVGGLALTFARHVGLTHLILGTIILQIIATAFSFGGLPHLSPPPPKEEESPRSWRDLFRETRTSSSSLLFVTIALATTLLVATRHALRYFYSARVAAAFGELDLATAAGLFFAIASLIAGLIQALVTPRLLTGVGLTTLNLAYATSIPFTFVLTWVAPPLVGAALARLIESEIKMAIKTPVSNLLYGGLPTSQRPAARAFILGAVVPLATGAASLALGLAPLGTRAWGLVAGLVLVGITIAQNRVYRRTFGAQKNKNARQAAENALTEGSEP